MNTDFMLYNETAKRIYEEVKNLPIIDYHCHLSAKEIYEDKQFSDITDVFLGHDHYKWRLMRNYGVEEKYITGNGGSKEKFVKFIDCLSCAVGSPIYAWTKMELSEYFDCELEITDKNAEEIYEIANNAIKSKKLSPSVIMQMSKVSCVCPVEEPFCDLEYYKLMKDKKGMKILPAFRGDKITNIADANFLTYLKEMSKVTNLSINSLDDLEKSIKAQLTNYQKVGCVSADFGFEFLESGEVDREKAGDEFHKRQNAENCQYKFFHPYILSFMLKECYKKNFAVQIHIGAKRNNNERMYKLLGSDSGFDSISKEDYLTSLIKILNSLDKVGKTIIFNLNPSDNEVIATTCGDFAEGGIKGKVQIGAAWWFNDTLSGMREMLNVFSNLSHFAVNVGMLTDSRSITAYPRHDYFRRILCDFLGEKAEKGEFTKNFDILTKIAKDVSYFNAKEYFNL